MSEVIHSECLGNGRLTELEVIREDSGLVRMNIAVGGNYGEIFRGSIEAARVEYKKLKKGAA